MQCVSGFPAIIPFIHTWWLTPCGICCCLYWEESSKEIRCYIFTLGTMSLSKHVAAFYIEHNYSSVWNLMEIAYLSWTLKILVKSSIIHMGGQSFWIWKQPTKFSDTKNVCREVEHSYTLSMKLSDRQGFETSMGHYFFKDSN